MPSPDLVKFVASAMLEKAAEKVGGIEVDFVMCWLYDVLAEIVDGLIA